MGKKKGRATRQEYYCLYELKTAFFYFYVADYEATASTYLATVVAESFRALPIA